MCILWGHRPGFESQLCYLLTAGKSLNLAAWHQCWPPREAVGLRER